MTKYEKMQVLEYYLLEKQLKFRDAILDDDGTNEGQEAMDLFEEPF